MDNPPAAITPDQLEIVRTILKRYVPQYETWAFGSRARGTQKTPSDLDLAIITDQPLPLSVDTALHDAFSASDLPWRVDIVDWAATREPFRRIIEQNKFVVCPAH